MSPRAENQGPTESLEPRAGDRLWLERFSLVVVDGPDRGALAMSPGQRMIIGTDRTCDFRLGDKAMSRFHCEIALGPDGIAIRDMGSTNGTRVDGVRVLQAYLRRGARLELGRNLLTFEMTAEQIGVDLFGGESFGRLSGRSVAMRAAMARLARAAASDITVLLTGETGVGKDVAAEAVHQESRRREGPFAVVDCGGLPRTLLESELFGHVRGAFTGAERDRVGAVEAASGGTLFLDEVGELPLDLQPALLRVLERREVKPLGTDRFRPVDVRVVAATNRDLRRDVNSGRFRADLYYRLAVLPVAIPALRERREDIPLIAGQLMDEIAGGDPAVRQQLGERVNAEDIARYDWPGNVRELKNYLESCAVLARPLLAAGDDGDWFGMPAPGASQPMRDARKHWLAWFERQYVMDLLERSGGNVSAAARAAGVDRAYLYRLMRRSGADE